MKKLFWREHLPLILFMASALLVVLLVFWYDGYDHPVTAAYAVFLGLTILAGYLAFRYFTHRDFYDRLSKPITSLEESIKHNESAPLPAALSGLMEEQYRQYRNVMEEWDRRRKEHLIFMNQWVHQMKTPLSVIEMITQEDDNDSYKSISEESDRIRRGLDMVLYMSRLETFEQDFSVMPVGLHQAVVDAVHENKRYFIHSHVYPEVRIETDLIVQTDAKWLRFVLLQLISNSIKYSAGSGLKVTITAYRSDNHREVLLEVIDRGIGIPTADLKRVFDPFYTGENGRKLKESTGMGLYLVQEVIRKMNHRIELESEPGQGTTVRLVFAL
ncbi:sensor histidine kinase [Paenibacillus sp. JCM 10914]|uniref:sensor histidine kinase n=1 Tax=Paenibacillus sp. JCM 10914 TaxID=1236974 RepID=UPI0003CC6870|nr:sensor histidine kinase [Paenibacillus sp. JCM 10914]GAE09492.1 two-component sensor kinase YvcQ [Paenibacillus sp. JCM 10914]